MKTRWMPGCVALLPLCAVAAEPPLDRLPSPEKPRMSLGSWDMPDDLTIWRYNVFDPWVAEANAGRAQAAIYVGDAYYRGMGNVPEDCKKALEWYLKARDLGSENAPSKLAETWSSFGCEVADRAAARKYRAQAVELGDVFGPREAARRAYFEVQNRSDDYLGCEMSIESQAFPSGERRILKRDGDFSPRTTRVLIAGRISGKPGKENVHVACTSTPATR